MKETFKAVAPKNIAQKIAEWYANDEKRPFVDVWEEFLESGILEFEKAVGGKECEYYYDLGYAEKSLDYVWCFEVNDRNWVVPVELLEVIQ